MFNITLSYYNGISKNCNYFFSIIKIKSFLCYENTAKSAYHRSLADMREHSAYIKKGLPRMSKKLINLMHIAKSYGDNVILDDLNLYIRENEFITLLGPSGCGKTTTLRIIGGFETPDKGQVLFDGKDITALPPNERDLNTVFQKYALFPHMSIAENIAFGLKIKKKQGIHRRQNQIRLKARKPGRIRAPLHRFFERRPAAENCHRPRHRQ